MADTFQAHSAGLTAPAGNAFPITPQDGVDLAFVTRAIYVGVSGNITLTMQGGQSVLLTNIAAGTVLPLRAARIAATGTTAQDLVGLY
jgi:hypothetical protein